MDRQASPNAPGFVHLHVHSHYSVGEAVPSVRRIVERAALLGMPAVALTDRNTIAGMHELVAAAEEFGIQPILGCELSVLPSSDSVLRDRTFSLVTLVENEQGYRNLTTLLSRSHHHAAGLPPHVTCSQVARHSDGLIFLIGSPESEIYHWLEQGDSAATKKYLTRFAAGLRENSLFFEVLEYPDPSVRKVMDYLLEVSRFLNIPAVATQNVLFLDPADILAYCCLVQNPKHLVPRWPVPEDEMPTRHFTTVREMEKRFGYKPHLLAESLRIAQRCSFRFPRTKPQVPLLRFERGQDPPSLLWELAVRGAAVRYGGLSDKIKARLNAEYEDVRGDPRTALDLSEYLLMLRDVAGIVREEGFCRGVGRQPLLSSVIAYSLGITEVDPIAHGLEYRPLRHHPKRFPPCDLEMSTVGMDALLRVLEERCGRDNFAAVGHRQDWDRSRLFHRLCRWANLPPAPLRQFLREARKASALRVPHLDPEEPGKGGGDDEARASDTMPAEASGPGEAGGAPTTDRRRGPLLGDDEIPRGRSLRSHQTLAEVTHALDPCPRAFEADRSQVVITKDPLENIIPVMTPTPGERLIQADDDCADRLLLPRLHFMTSTVLNVLETAQRIVREQENSTFSLLDIPTDDDETFRLLGLGLTNGISPLHTITAKSLLRAERVDSIDRLLSIRVRAGRRKADDSPVDEKTLGDSLPDCLLSYWCAFLKVHHPIPFMAAMLTHSLSTRTPASQRSRFQILLRESRKMGIEVLGPHINFSAYEFTQERRRIRTGLMVVQSLGERTYAEVDAVRRGMPFMNIEDFCQRTDPARVSSQVVVNLIKAGAFDFYSPNRGGLMLRFEVDLRKARGRGAADGTDDDEESGTQLQLFDSEIFASSNEPDLAEEQARNEHPSTPEEIVRLEQEAVGYPVSYDSLDYYDGVTRLLRAISPFEISARHEGREVNVVGFIDHLVHDGPLVNEPGETILDLEGHVVRLPPKFRDEGPRALDSQGPVLITGAVVKQRKSEYELVARELHLIDEIAQRAELVAVLQIDLTGEDRRTLRLVHQVLREYRGEVEVEVQASGDLPRLMRRRIGKCRVFYCPPLHQALRRILSARKIAAFGHDGKRLDF